MGIKSEIENTKQNVVLARSFDDYRIFLTRVQEKEFMVHNWLEIVYVLKGKIELSDEDEIIDLDEGDIYIINPGKAHLIKETQVDNIVLILQIENKFLKENIPGYNEILFSNRMDDLTKQKIISVMGRLYINTFTTDWEIEDMNDDLEELLTLLVTKRYYPKRNKELLDIDSIVIEIAKRASQEYVNLCKKNISLEDMADEYNVSYYYLSRSFKKNIGENYTDFLLKVRLNKAVDLIVNTDKMITDIAEESGFSNIKSFNNAFRKVFTISPTDFRKKYSDLDKMVIKSELFLDEKVQEFIKDIKIKKDNILKGRIEYNIDYNSDPLLERKEWAKIVDINCLFDILEGFDNFERITENIEFTSIILNIKVIDEKVYLINKHGEMRYLNEYESNNLIRVLNQSNISPIIFLNYDIASMDINPFSDMAIKKIDSISRIIGFNKLRSFVFGIKINDIDEYLYTEKEYEIISIISKFKDLLDKKFNGEEYKWAVHFGKLDTNEDLDNIKTFIDKIEAPDYSMVLLNYNHKEPRLDYAINYYINMLNNLKQHIQSYGIQNKLLTSFDYNIDNLDISNPNKINFANLFILYLALKLRSNNQILSSIRLSGEDTKDIDRNALDRYLFNDLGLRLPTYYMFDFIDLLGEDLIYVDEGIFVTRKGANLVMLIFDDYIKYYNYSSKMLADIEAYGNMEYRLKINGLTGTFKLSEYRVDMGNKVYDALRIEEKYKQSITEWEKKHLDYMYIPDVKISFLEVEDEDKEFELISNKNLMDIHLINLEKI